LERLEGVKKVRTRFEGREVSVVYDPTRVTVEKLIATIERLGYQARVVTSGEERGK